jgi:hypothetical protein
MIQMDQRWINFGRFRGKSGQDAQLSGPGDRFGPAVDPQFFVDVEGMALDGIGR